MELRGNGPGRPDRLDQDRRSARRPFDRPQDRTARSADSLAHRRGVPRDGTRQLPPRSRCWSTSATPTQPAAALRLDGTPTSARTSPAATRPALGTKNLLGLPWRVALALQDDGWILRNAIIWHKPNAMPESVHDRMSCRYELIFLLVKSRHYWFDLDPIRVPHTTRPRPAPPADAAPLTPGRRCRARIPGRCSAHSATVPVAAARFIRSAATPATCGPSPPAPTPVPTSPRSDRRPGPLHQGRMRSASPAVRRHRTQPRVRRPGGRTPSRHHPAGRRPSVTGHPR